MNLVLIGYRGTGKSEVSRRLSSLLGMERIAMDDEIVRRAGMSIPEIVARDGWPAFRDRESALARELADGDNRVIDTGGGIVERPENIAALRERGCIVWMKAEVPTIVARISGGTERPALTEGKSFTDEVAEVLERRTPLYQAAAQFEVETDRLTPEEIAKRIVGFWRELTCRTP